jgi:hypothetical protein
MNPWKLDGRSDRLRLATRELDGHFAEDTPSVPANRFPLKLPRAETPLCKRIALTLKSPSYCF